MKWMLAMLATLTMVSTTYAEDTFVTGKMTNLRVISEGILIKMDSGVPTNCIGTPEGWIGVPQAYTSMVSVVLSSWVTSTENITVHTNPFNSADGYCLVNQIDL